MTDPAWMARMTEAKRAACHTAERELADAQTLATAARHFAAANAAAAVRAGIMGDTEWIESDWSAAMADAPVENGEAVVENRARQTIADLATGAVGTQTINDLAYAVARARMDGAAGRAINRGMERE